MVTLVLLDTELANEMLLSKSPIKYSETLRNFCAKRKIFKWKNCFRPKKNGGHQRRPFFFPAPEISNSNVTTAITRFLHFFFILFKCKEAPHLNIISQAKSQVKREGAKYANHLSDCKKIDWPFSAHLHMTRRGPWRPFVELKKRPFTARWPVKIVKKSETGGCASRRLHTQMAQRESGCCVCESDTRRLAKEKGAACWTCPFWSRTRRNRRPFSLQHSTTLHLGFHQHSRAVVFRFHSVSLQFLAGGVLMALRFIQMTKPDET